MTYDEVIEFMDDTHPWKADGYGYDDAMEMAYVLRGRINEQEAVIAALNIEREALARRALGG